MPQRETADQLVAREPHRRAAIAALASGRGVAVLGRPGTGRTAFARSLTVALPTGRYAVSWTTATAALPGAAFTVGTPEAATAPAGPRGWARDRIPVVVVDDAHELGDADAATLLALPARVRLIVTARTGRPWCGALRALVKDHLNACTLGDFTPDTTGLATVTALGGAVARPAVDLLHRWTGGNPRLLAGLIEHGHATGRLERRAGLWWWRGDTGSPPCLPDLFAEELGGVSPADADVIAALSLGVPLDLDDAERLAAGAAERLEEHRIVRPETAACRTVLHWANPLLGAAFAGGVPATRRRRVAAVLLAADPAGDERNPVAYARWRLAAPDTAGPGSLLKLAWRVRDTDPRAAALLTGQVAGRTGTAAATLAHAAALLRLGDYETAASVLAMCDAREPADRAGAAVLRAWLRRWAGPDPSGARAELPAVDHPEVTACDGALLLLAGRPREARDRIAPLIGDPGLPEDVTAEARAVHAAASALAGHAAGWTTPADSATPVAAVHAWTLLWQDAGGVPAGLPDGVAAAALDGYARWLDGDPDTAMHRWREALGNPAAGPRPLRTETTAWLATCLAEQGRADEAAAVLAGAVPAGPGLCALPGVVSAARAAIAAALGDLPAAGEHIETAIAAAHETGATLVELGHLVHAARLRGATGPATVADRIHALLPAVRAPRLALLGAATIALTRADGAELLSFARQLAEARLPEPAGRFAEAAAALLSGTGDPRRAQARTLLSTLHGTGTGAEPAGAPQLTVREAEVAGLAASGLTDREISHRLTVSVRTVESHLSRVYRKLGVSSRRALRVRVAHG
ncbi:LuxR C-terminal-related transcriptional regulator [Actinoplanes sp. NPDC023801]|uniref:helix-turn-helix transcriptional regulator n=1 Tax=Actinoplanes sp. NPDC023801 TaxID=3154595 RepID=UPI0033FE78B3